MHTPDILKAFPSGVEVDGEATPERSGWLEVCSCGCHIYIYQKDGSPQASVQKKSLTNHVHDPRYRLHTGYTIVAVLCDL